MSFQLIPQAYAASWSSINPECVGGTNIGGFQVGVPGFAVGLPGVDASNVATITGFECLIRNILSPLPALLALVAVFMVIFAGIRIVTAGSDPKALTAAWNSFTYAIIGLILLSGVWLVLVLIEKFTGAQVTQFGI